MMTDITGDGRGLQPEHQHVALVPAAEPAPLWCVAGVVGGRVVVAGRRGGRASGFVDLTSVEAYTPTGWTPLPPLPHATNWPRRAC